jgi:nitrile hydratase accessory protein
MTAPAPPAPFDAPWHAQAFALAVALNEAGLYSWSDWTERFGADLQAARAQDPLDGSDDYFTVWLTTLEAMLRAADPARHRDHRLSGLGQDHADPAPDAEPGASADLAVVVNEFGDVGVDGEILKSCAIPDCPAENIMELANGCICCTVADDFIPTIEALMALDPQPDTYPDRNLGSGAAETAAEGLRLARYPLAITVDGVIALADAEAVAAGRFAPDVAAVDAQRAGR